MTDWVSRAQRLADEITVSGKLRSLPWRAAVCAVPRHELVPSYYEQDTNTGQWRLVDTTAPEMRARWLDLVYSDTTLITAVAEYEQDSRTRQLPVSSATKPGLAVRMLEELDVHDGHRVLEIGTGSGYTAALLSARLGSANVHSVDLRPQLIQAARERLAWIGYQPTLAAVDGDNGLPEHSPYDRVIATCATPTVPWAWIEQTRPGGVLLIDLKRSMAGNLVKLRSDGHRAEGRFLPWWAGFMAMTHATELTGVPTLLGDPATAETGPAGLDPAVLDDACFTFFAQLHLPTGISLRAGIATNGARTARLAGDSPDTVAEHDPDQLWSTVRRAQQHWQQLGRPRWERFGLTATPERQWIWLDQPNGPHSWPLDPPG
ncbi:MAG: methyltransferase domain-containing protein [Actinomycetota bacterium]|nr:methyltransferase domain-containing protein [Actinomycetota bacterium]